ncbi:hypothetical protein B0H66DRAFT_567718 [Apodospora peruviana]|uniref:Uncharacterized protein n=1 Tax=Apodospora peruviana TaxID=516989 RepID=A0AAE0M071_9PEZI|nr:hypothetical protein B0H66DRAFT_567718 [Apodospora peruviana]
MPLWDSHNESADISAIQLLDGRDSSSWAVSACGQRTKQQPKISSAPIPGEGSLLDFYDLSKPLDTFTLLDAPESPPSSSDDDSESCSESSPDRSPSRSLLTLDSITTNTTPTKSSWRLYKSSETTPPHLRAFRRPRSTTTRPQQLQVQPPKLLTSSSPQLLERDLTADAYYDGFLLPSPLSPCMRNFPSAPQNSPCSPLFANNTTLISKKTEEKEEKEPIIVTATCRRTPYYPPNASQTEDRSRVYMNRGPHYIANWTPLSSLPIDAQRRIERSMVKFTAPEVPEDKRDSHSELL